MSKSHTEWTARAVQEAIEDSSRSKMSLSDETGIPYSTLNRKLQANAEFTFSELLLIAEALGVRPSQFTPPEFARIIREDTQAA